MEMASLLRPLSRQAVSCSRRTFSTSRTLPVSLQWQDNHPESLADAVPPYPYGPTLWYKQSSKGLYGGQRVRFGNNVSDKFEVKTRRSWHPNVKTKRLYSKALNRHVQVRVTTKVLRTIDKLGGLDEYLLGEKEGRIKELGESGWWLRWAVMQTPVVKRKFAAQREALGLPSTEAGPAEKSMAEMANAEAEGAVEAAAHEFENAEGVEPAEFDQEEIRLDNAFEIEQPAELPPLKFRVAPHQHLYLTPTGWKRVREDPERRLNDEKERLFRDFHGKHKAISIEDVRRTFDARQRALDQREEKLKAAGDPEGPASIIAGKLRRQMLAAFKVPDSQLGVAGRTPTAANPPNASADVSRTKRPEATMNPKAASKFGKSARRDAKEQVEQAIMEIKPRILQARQAQLEQELVELREARALLTVEREHALAAAPKDFNAYARRWAEDSQNQRLAEKSQRQQEKVAAKKLAKSEKRAFDAEAALRA